MARTRYFCKETSGSERRKAVRLLRRAVMVGVASATMWGGIGAGPASAVETYGAPLPNYDPGVQGTIRYDLANCGIVLFEAINYQGKKLCAPALGDAYLGKLVSLSLQGADLGADMDWSHVVSSVQVRPGFRLQLWEFAGSSVTQREYLEDTPNLGDFNDRTTHVAVGAYNWGEGNNNSADGQPVTTTNATSCTSTQGPEKAVDNSVASIYTNKWCGVATSPLMPWTTPPTLQVDLGADRLINGVVVHHAGDGPLTTVSVPWVGTVKVQRESDLYNTVAYNVKVSSLPTGPWTLAGTFSNPYSADVSNHRLLSADNRLYRARYVRLEVTIPSNLDWAARIQEFEVLTLNR